MIGSRKHRPSRKYVGALVVATAVASACIVPSAGQAPPLDSLYYPTGLAVSPGGSALYVASSDFDLQYNGGSLITLDLGAVRSRLSDLRTALEKSKGSQAGCGLLGSNDNRLLSPAPCGALDIGPYVRNKATIGAFASTALIVKRPGGIAGARLFVPVRGDPSITYFDVTDDSDPANLYSPCLEGGAFCLDCGQANTQDRRCADAHRMGQNPADNPRGITLPVEPVGLAAADFDGGNLLVVAHQSGGAASLLTNPWQAGGPWTPSDRPALQFTVAGLPDGPTGVAAVPEPALVAASREASGDSGGLAYEPGFLVTYRGAAEVDLLRYHVDEGDPSRPFLTRAGGVGISALAEGYDSRGIALDASERQACEAECASGARADLLACLTACTAIPLRFFVANRTPASLLVGQVETVLTQTGVAGAAKVTSAFERLSIQAAVPLSYGASNVALGHVVDRDGKLSLRVFAVAFDSRFVFSYDPEARRVDQVIRTGRGPHAIAFDTGGTGDSLHSFLLVGHFTDSYVGVVDLDMRHRYTFGSMFASLGQPLPPKESK